MDIKEYLKEGIDTLKKVNNISYFYAYNFSNFRALMNITMPYSLDERYYEVEKQIIEYEYKFKEVIDVNSLQYNQNIALVKGDITLLKADAIVNAANKKLLGCLVPLHNCIDNCIHSFAGLKMRKELMEIMEKQREDEKVGKVKVTLGYNLPSKYVFHTIGPKAFYNVNEKDREDLRNCYLSCLKKADELNLKNIVFCSISTGVYGFPIDEASIIAIDTVRNYLKEVKTNLHVVFDLFSSEDFNIYSNYLSNNK